VTVATSDIFLPGAGAPCNLRKKHKGSKTHSANVSTDQKQNDASTARGGKPVSVSTMLSNVVFATPSSIAVGYANSIFRSPWAAKTLCMVGIATHCLNQICSRGYGAAEHSRFVRVVDTLGLEGAVAHGWEAATLRSSHNVSLVSGRPALD
jgi:hypothetical protein